MSILSYQRMFTAFIVLGVLLLPAKVLSQTITVQPGISDGKDAMIDTTNTLNPQFWYIPRGNQTIAGFGIDWCYPDGFNVICHEQLLIDFDLTGISDTTFVSAKIVLYTSSNNPNFYFHTSNFSVSNIISPWSENMVTWLNRPSFDTAGIIYFATHDTINDDSISIDITPLVRRKMAFPDLSYGFAVSYIGWDTIGGAFVYSSEYSDPTKHPKLVVSYNNNTNSINSLLENKEIRLHPNPFTSDISISIKAAFEGLGAATFTITNLVGQTIYRKEETNLATGYTKMLDLSMLANGVYFVSVGTGEGMVTKKVVKQ